MGWGKPFRAAGRGVTGGLPALTKGIGQVQQNVHRAWDTTRGIAADVEKYGEQAAEDVGKWHRDTVENAFKPENLKQLFNDPLRYGRKQMEPTFGSADNPTGGLWDKYGGWTAAIPGAGWVVYGVGQAANAAYDYNRTGNEDLFRDQARQTAATLAAKGVMQGAGDYVDPELAGGYARPAAMGAAGGAVASQGRDEAGGKDAVTGAAIGGLAAITGEALSGKSTGVPERDASGNVIRDVRLDPNTGQWVDTGDVVRGTYYNPNSLGFSYDSTAYGDPARTLGNQAVTQTYNAGVQQRRRKDYQSMLEKYRQDLSAYLQNWQQGQTNQKTLSAPAWLEGLGQTQQGSEILGTSGKGAEEKSLRNLGIGGTQLASPGTQLAESKYTL
jgi:hypothetical protein